MCENPCRRLRAQFTFPLYPALRLRLCAGLLLFRPCGAGFLVLHSTAANKTQFSHRLLRPGLTIATPFGLRNAWGQRSGGDRMGVDGPRS